MTPTTTSTSPSYRKPRPRRVRCPYCVHGRSMGGRISEDMEVEVQLPSGLGWVQLSVLRVLEGGPASAPAMRTRTGIPLRRIEDAACSLIRRGLVERSCQQEHDAHTYRRSGAR